MSWLKLTLQEESSSVLSAHPLYQRAFWVGIFQSSQCWLNSTIKFTGSFSPWFIKSRTRAEIRPFEEVHGEILSWAAHLLKTFSSFLLMAFLLVAVERKDQRKLDQCALVGKQMLLPWIFCSWRWWNSFWGSYGRSFLLPSALCHATYELISPCNLLSCLIHLWYLSHPPCGFEMFLLSTLGCDGRRCVPTFAFGVIRKTENSGKALLQKFFRNYKLWNNRKTQCRLETCSQGCPEQQWKSSVGHIVCLPYFLSFSQCSFQPPPPFVIPGWWW